VRRAIAAGLLIAAGACGPARPAAAPAAAAPAGPARRACPAASAVDPPSCVAAAVRGRTLKDDPAAHVRIFQACAGGRVVDGTYLAERVGAGPATGDRLHALLDAHQREVMELAAVETAVEPCGPGAGDCIEVGFQEANEDVPSVAADLARIFADAGDACVPFRIVTSVPPGT
jgi:hypothetical protein